MPSTLDVTCMHAPLILLHEMVKHLCSTYNFMCILHVMFFFFSVIKMDRTFVFLFVLLKFKEIWHIIPVIFFFLQTSFACKFHVMTHCVCIYIFKA